MEKSTNGFDSMPMVKASIIVLVDTNDVSVIATRVLFHRNPQIDDDEVLPDTHDVLVGIGCPNIPRKITLSQAGGKRQG
ncbi:hypothetical protein [Pseudomonas moraviensis]